MCDHRKVFARKRRIRVRALVRGAVGARRWKRPASRGSATPCTEDLAANGDTTLSCVRSGPIALRVRTTPKGSRLPPAASGQAPWSVSQRAASLVVVLARSKRSLASSSSRCASSRAVWTRWAQPTRPGRAQCRHLRQGRDLIEAGFYRRQFWAWRRVLRFDNSLFRHWGHRRGPVSGFLLRRLSVVLPQAISGQIQFTSVSCPR